MPIIDQLKWRYATKKFDDTKLLSNEKLTVLKEAFNLTATSYGLQPVKLIIIKNKALQQQLVPHSMDQLQVLQASHVLVICIETAVDAKYIETYFNRVKEVRNTPDAVLEPFKTFLIDSFEKKQLDELNNWAINQAYITLGNLLTVCAVEGIDACPMEGFDSKIYDELLGLEAKQLKSVLVLPVGYRAKDDMFIDLKKVRKKLTESILEI